MLVDNNIENNNEQKALCSFLTIILKENENIDIINLLSFLSLLFKVNIDNDNAVQNFEVKVLRRNAFKIISLNDLYNLFLKENIVEEHKDIFNVLTIINDFVNNDDFNVENVNDDVCLQLINNVGNILKETKNNIIATENLKQSTLQIIDEEKNYRITPTQGIQWLNNNPYEFFVSKVLNLSQIEDWSNTINSGFYGNLVHNIIQKFSEKIKILKQQKQQLNKQTMLDIFNNTKMEVLLEQGIDYMFLEEKLSSIADVVVNIEYNALKNNRYVMIEQSISSKYDNLTIYARADRIEIDDKNKNIYIYDFKTGEVPDNNKEASGEKVQLLIIAMLLLRSKQYQDFRIKKLSYIDVSGKEFAENKDIDIDEMQYIDLKIKNMINTFFDKNGKPILSKFVYIKPSGNFLYSKDYMLMKMQRIEFIC